MLMQLSVNFVIFVIDVVRTVLYNLLIKQHHEQTGEPNHGRIIQIHFP